MKNVHWSGGVHTQIYQMKNKNSIYLVAMVNMINENSILDGIQFSYSEDKLLIIPIMFKSSYFITEKNMYY